MIARRNMNTRTRNFLFTLYTCSFLISLSLTSAFAPTTIIHNNSLQLKQQQIINVNTLQNTINTSKETNYGLYLRTTLINKQRKSISSIQTMSLFGLGVPELAVISIAIFFVLGPTKIVEMARSAGQTASDFRDVPKEFQKGLEEGETEARSKKAKPMEEVDEDK